ncbi:MAG TPA: hypothetical protein VFL99_06715 [Segeticoccus sp.]|uniref:hypothetical protein n=1 Tax=Segeticoccus sp. TaxID=2706531 RepID=UPI002D7FBCD1|nr:hypothetical protein [Segeticoccus sp.]HET8600000.1 hypothetical protein [Segeticoccus sp.]
MNEMQAWLAGRLPDGWFTEAPTVTVDRDEILVVGRLAEPSTEAQTSPETDTPQEATAAESPSEGSAEADRQAAQAGRINRFREETRGKRMRIADEAEARFGRKVAWGAACGETRHVFTNLAVPVMTRLRQPERQVLDTLIDGGVARSRSEALAWCVRLVGQHEDEWLTRLREALVGVAEAREAGPAA